MRLYVAGPMRGHPERNYPAFREATARLREAGYDVVDPSSLHSASLEEPTTAEAQARLKLDLKALLECDAVALLQGWSNSEGAALEQRVAETLGMRTIGLEYWLTAADVR